jgi:hypothetical protein
MSPYLLFILLNLPHIPGPVTPEDFPSGIHSLDADSATHRKYFSFQGRDTLVVRVGESRSLNARWILSGGCPVRETDFASKPEDPDRNTDFTCSGGKVIGWFNGVGDSGVYVYKDGRLDSLLRFEKVTSKKPFTKSRTMKVRYDAEGRPDRTQNYWFEGSDTAEDSLTTTIAYHLPDSVVMKSVSVPQAESRVTVLRLSEGKIVAMTETVVDADEPDEIWTFHHVWTYGEPNAIRARGPARRNGMPSDTRSFRTGDGWWRMDGRRYPAPR